MNLRKPNTLRLTAILLVLSIAIPGTALAGGTIGGQEPAYRDWPLMENRPPVSKARLHRAETIAKQILGRLTLEQKIGQITQGEIRSVTPEDVAQYCLGSVLNGGGSWPAENMYSSPAEWRALADAYWQAGMDSCGIPPIWGIDSVHGNNNVFGATVFPHNIGLGAANNPALMKRIGVATARETRATGQPWVFAPTVAVARDYRWGRTYESYSEDPQRVRRLVGPLIRGLQGDLDGCHVAATAKHWLGDGGTTNGTDQGNTEVTEEELINIHGLPYFTAMRAGVLSVMPSYSAWNGERMHGNRTLITDVLKDTLGFSGHVISDWNAIGQVPDCTDSDCPQAVNAGIDLFMVPWDWATFLDATLAQVESGVIPIKRIDDAVLRVLRNKALMGLFDEKPSEALCAQDEQLGAQVHRNVARRAVRESLVLLKNDGNILPLARDTKVLVTGIHANNIPYQSGGWTLTWQGTNTGNGDFPGATSIYDGISEIAPGADLRLYLFGVDFSEYDVAVVVIGEPPYAEYFGDIPLSQTIDNSQRNQQGLFLLEYVKATGIPVVTVFVSGRPLYVNKELNRSEAFVAAWLPGSEGGGIADVLFAGEDGGVNHDFVGRLPFTWPGDPCQASINLDDPEDGLFPFGFGLNYSDSVLLGTLEESTVDGGCAIEGSADGGGRRVPEPAKAPARLRGSSGSEPARSTPGSELRPR